MGCNCTDQSSNFTCFEKVSRANLKLQNHIFFFCLGKVSKLPFCNIGGRNTSHSFSSCRTGTWRWSLGYQRSQTRCSCRRHTLTVAVKFQQLFFCLFVVVFFQSKQLWQQEAGSKRFPSLCCGETAALTFMESQVWRLAMKCQSVLVLCWRCSVQTAVAFVRSSCLGSVSAAEAPVRHFNSLQDGKRITIKCDDVKGQ